MNEIINSYAAKSSQVTYVINIYKIKLMKKILLFMVSAVVAGVVRAQVTVNRDREISDMVKEVNADSLQSYIKTMVAFGTRSTVSSTTDRKRGIGAAREWVLSKFNQFAAASGGRLTAFVDTSTYAGNAKRVGKRSSMGNNSSH